MSCEEESSKGCGRMIREAIISNILAKIRKILQILKSSIYFLMNNQVSSIRKVSLLEYYQLVIAVVPSSEHYLRKLKIAKKI